MSKFFSYVLTAVLFSLALLVGLFLPEAVNHAQEAKGAVPEPANIEPVALSENSGLLNAEKINILADETCQMTAIASGKHQDAASLSSSVWNFLEMLTYYGTTPQTLLDTDTAEQKTHGAWLVMLDAQVFIVWEVLFADDLGNQLRVYIDDESRIPLGMSYTSVNPVSPDEMQVDTVLDVIGIMNGLYTLNVVQITPDEIQEQPATDKNTRQNDPEAEKASPSNETTQADVDTEAPLQETLFFRITLSTETGDQQCIFPLELDFNGFRFNWVG